jgi:hypothetical protein
MMSRVMWCLSTGSVHVLCRRCVVSECCVQLDAEGVPVVSRVVLHTAGAQAAPTAVTPDYHLSLVVRIVVCVCADTVWLLH